MKHSIRSPGAGRVLAPQASASTKVPPFARVVIPTRNCTSRKRRQVTASIPTANRPQWSRMVGRRKSGDTDCVRRDGAL